MERVAVEGARGADADRVRMALTAAARDMTTLHVDHDRLQRAVGGYSSVRTLEVSPDFPHSLRIRVVEHRPVAMAVGGAGRVPVAATAACFAGCPPAARCPP